MKSTVLDAPEMCLDGSIRPAHRSVGVSESCSVIVNGKALHVPLQCCRPQGIQVHIALNLYATHTHTIQITYVFRSANNSIITDKPCDAMACLSCFYIPSL